MQEGNREVASLISALLQEPESQALCAARSGTGHAFELRYELLHGGWIILRFHDLAKRWKMAGSKAASTQSRSTQKRGAAM